MITKKQIFDLVKSEKFDKLKQYIEKNPDIELDIQDDNYNHFIHYVINYNQIELLKTLFNNTNVRLDIFDTDGRNLLYVPVKYNYIEILNLLIENNNKSIGINIIDIKDKIGLTGLHYACIFNNINAIKILLKVNADPYIINKEGNNVFHLALQYKRNDILYFLLENTDNINFVNSHGENLLQLALTYENDDIVSYLLKTKINVNNTDIDFGLSALHQSIVLNKNEFSLKLIQLGCDINKSDFMGNTPLHYVIIEKNYEFLKILTRYEHLIYDTSNLHGNTALHLLLDDNTDINDNLKIMIKKTNLNIQNSDGITCFHLIVKNNIWKNEEIQLILKAKELNLFIQNIKGENILSYTNEKEQLIDLVSKSYYYQIKKNKTKLVIEWEKYCSNDDFINLAKKLNKRPKHKVSSEKNSSAHKDVKKLCIENIKNIIMNESRSMPQYEEINLLIDNGIIVDTCYYTGSTIDILFGIIWLNSEFNKLGLILEYPLTKNEELEEYYNKLGLSYQFKLDFSNVEIIWSYQKLIYPSYFDYFISNMSNYKNKKYIIIPIGIEVSQGAHANILFWDLKKKIVERFEPNGANYPRELYYNPSLLDDLLRNKFTEIDEKIKYYSPSDYLPPVGFQLLESMETPKCKKIGDPNGFCAIWCTWWCYQKLKNPKVNSDKLANELIKTIRLDNKSFKNIIRNFSKNISQIRDKYLKKYKIDINDWMSNNYSEDILNKIEKDILNLI